MKQKLLGIGSDLLILFINHWALISIAITLMGVGGSEKTQLPFWCALYIVPVCLYFIRAYIRNVYLFFALHIMMLAFIAYIPSSIEMKVIMIVMTLFYVITSAKIRLSEGEEEPLFVPAFSICLISACCILNEILAGKAWSKYYVLIFFVYIIGYFFYHFMSHYISFISVNKNSASNIPEREIFVSGMKQTGVYVAAGCMILVCSINIEWLTYIVRIVGSILAMLLRFLISFFNSEESEPMTMPQEDGAKPDMMGFLEPGETHPFWIILQEIAIVVFCVAIVAAAIYGAVKLYQYLINRFYAPRRKKKIEVQMGQDIRENCDIEIKRNRGLGVFAFLNNKERVRKIYRKRILKHKNDIIGDRDIQVLGYVTAKECCDIISAKSLKQIYEKARYSKESISAEDIKLAKVEE